MSDIARVGVVGCGPMGAGIAELSDLADRDLVIDLVIEAATENPDVKAALFAELDRVVKRPGEDTTARAAAFVTGVLGKTVITAPDRRLPTRCTRNTPNGCMRRRRCCGG
jgi:hypothetical protein